MLQLPWQVWRAKYIRSNELKPRMDFTYDASARISQTSSSMKGGQEYILHSLTHLKIHNKSSKGDIWDPQNRYKVHGSTVSWKVQTLPKYGRLTRLEIERQAELYGGTEALASSKRWLGESIELLIDIFSKVHSKSLCFCNHDVLWSSVLAALSSAAIFSTLNARSLSSDDLPSHETTNLDCRYIRLINWTWQARSASSAWLMQIASIHKYSSCSGAAAGLLTSLSNS